MRPCIQHTPTITAVLNNCGYITTFKVYAITGCFGDTNADLSSYFSPNTCLNVTSSYFGRNEFCRNCNMDDHLRISSGPCSFFSKAGPCWDGCSAIVAGASYYYSISVWLKEGYSLSPFSGIGSGLPGFASANGHGNGIPMFASPSIYTAMNPGTPSPIIPTQQTNSPPYNGGPYGQKLATGLNHTLVAKSDGTVWAVGTNNDGQLGDGTWTSSLTLTEASGLSNIVAVAAGNHHSMALDGSGDLWAWGEDGSHQLGDGATTDENQPIPVVGVSGAISVAATAAGSLVAESDGTVKAWGDISFGSHVISCAPGSTPTVITGLSNIVAVAGGANCALALRLDGTVWSFGSDQFGQLGNGGTTGFSTGSCTPVKVSSVTGVVV